MKIYSHDHYERKKGLVEVKIVKVCSDPDWVLITLNGFTQKIRKLDLWNLEGSDKKFVEAKYY